MAIACEFWMVRALTAVVGGIFYIFVLVVIIVQRSKRFNSAYYNFLISLGIGDTLNNIYMFLHGNNYCNDPGSAAFRCYMNFFPETSDVVALFSMACIAGTRYVAVAKPTRMDEIIGAKRQVISIVVTWICGIGFGTYYIMIGCFFQLDLSIRVMAFDHPSEAIGLFVSLITIGFCVATGKILWEMAKSKVGDGKLRKRSFYLFITILVMLFLYVFIRITTTVRVDITDSGDTSTIEFQVFAVYGSRAARVIFTTVNPFLYMVFDKEVRKAVVEVLNRIRHRNKVMPNTTIGLATMNN